MDRARLQPRELGQLLLGRAEGRQCLRGTHRENLAGLGQPAAAAVALDEALPRRRLQQPQMLARARLADADLARSRREAAETLDLDEQPHAGRVPESSQRCHIDADDI